MHAQLRASSLLVMGTLLLPLGSSAGSACAQGADQNVRSLSEEVAQLKAQNEQLRTLIPSQSHAMLDVAYHFTNLWFAGKHANWPLAQFYFNEARSHILWAIRIVPVRKNGTADVKLAEIFEGFDGTVLSALQKRIEAQDQAGFTVAYRDALAGCNACHTASGKPFLRIVVPDAPEVHIVELSVR